MNYVIFDLEWNQPMDAASTVLDPVYLPGEIVQIGAVKTDSECNILDRFQLLIRPVFYPKMHHRIAALTGIYDRQLQQEGLPFQEALRSFLDWCGEDFLFLNWSESDMIALVQNMLAHGMDTGELAPFADAQRIFSREVFRTDRRISLEEAMKAMKEQGDRAHDALHDAENTAKICRRMDLEDCLEEYRTAIYSLPGGQSCYDTSRECLDDPALRQVECPWCGSPMECESWVPGRIHPYVTMATCPEGDEYLLSLTCHRLSDGRVLAERLLFDMSDDLYDRYCDCKEAPEQSAALN